MSLVDTISAMKVQPWNRITMADGQWLQEKTVQQLDDRDIELAKAIDELSGGQGGDGQWVTSDPNAWVDVMSGGEYKNFYHGRNYKLRGYASTIVADGASADGTYAGLFHSNLIIKNSKIKDVPNTFNYGMVQDSVMNNIHDSIFNLKDTSATMLMYSFAYLQSCSANNIYNSYVNGVSNLIKPPANFAYNYFAGAENKVTAEFTNNIMVGSRNEFSGGPARYSFIVGEDMKFDGLQGSYVRGNDISAYSAQNCMFFGRDIYAGYGREAIDVNYPHAVNQKYPQIYGMGIGEHLNIKGCYSISLGENITNWNDFSINVGRNITNTDDYSMVVGLGLTTPADYSLTLGRYNTPHTGDVLEIGYGTSGDGNTNFAVDYYGNVAAGQGLDRSWASDDPTHRPSLIIGKYNGAPTDDMVLQVGYGTSDSDRKTIFYIDTSGGIHLTGDIYLENGKHIMSGGQPIL